MPLAMGRCVRALVGLGFLCLAAAPGHAEFSAAERNGKRLYTEGIAASGATVSARVGLSQAAVPGHLLPCVNCHGADAQGRPEGGIRPPAIAWRELVKPYGHVHDAAGGSRGRSHPAFDTSSFGRAVTEGLDPAGNRLDPAMPRYTLAASDIRDLVAYLQRIEDDHDPGLSIERIRIGTLLPADGPLAGAAATVASQLEFVFADINARGGIHGRQIDLIVERIGSDAASARAAWQHLVTEQRVFAIVAPLVPPLEQALPGLADAAGVPVVALPSAGGLVEAPRHVFFPVAGEAEQLRGLHAALREDAGDSDAAPNLPGVVMRSGSPRDDALAALLDRLAGQTLPRAALGPSMPAMDGVVSALRQHGATSVFFLGAETDLPVFMAAADRAGWRPRLLLPAWHAATVAPGVPHDWAGRVYLAVPSLPGDLSPAARETLQRASRSGSMRPSALQPTVHAVAEVLLEGLRRAGRALSRARLIESLEGLHGFATGMGPPVAFGPGRRLGAMGVHVIRPATAGQPVTHRYFPLSGESQ